MPSKARTYAVTVRFSEAEKKKLEVVAEQNGITISDVIRMCVNRVHASGEFMDLSQNMKFARSSRYGKIVKKKKGGR
jgi:antitoxin component of RelBE/YafQ-DinJ toxin-antitoxin module